MNPELHAYIASARGKGESDDAIKSALLGAGWEEGIVNSALGGESNFVGQGSQVFGDEKGFHLFGHTLPYVITGLACLLVSLVVPITSVLLELDVFDFDELLVLIYSVVLAVLVAGLLITTNIALRVTKVSKRVFAKSLFIVGVTSLPAMLVIFAEEYFQYSDFGELTVLLSPILMACVYVVLLKYVTEKSIGYAIGTTLATVFGTALFVYGVYFFATEML